MSAFVFVLPTWAPEPWVKAMRSVAPNLDVRTWPDVGNIDEVTYTAAWLPPANVLKSFPNLKLICSLGAGVDAILSDPTLPANIPIVRVNDPDLTNRMSEYIVLQVLLHHRQHARYSENQKLKIWDSFATHAASALTVGIMGLGVLGQDAAQKLKLMGFNVLGWSRSKKLVDGIKCYSQNERDEFLNQTDILVSLLPATPETDGIIDRKLIQKLSRKGPFGAPIVINAGRGRQQNETDILECLDNGELYAASLDVFKKEPLPPQSALWSHPKITITPHLAADSDPTTICKYVFEQIMRFEQGLELQNLVDKHLGY